MIKTLVLILSFSFSAKAADSKSFNLYAQGKVLESVAALKQELKTEKYNALVLNSQFKRLLSSYKNHLGVTDRELIEILKLMLREQPAVKEMESDVAGFVSELEALVSSKPSLKQVDTYLSSAVSRGHDTSIISNDRKRLTKFNVARLYASRQIKTTKGEERAQWTYLAGKAGFYHFNSGNAELKLYLQMCERLGKVPACSDVKNAHSMLNLGKAIESPVQEKLPVQ